MSKENPICFLTEEQGMSMKLSYIAIFLSITCLSKKHVFSSTFILIDHDSLFKK